MASSLLVVLPMAETTTTGFRSARARTMDATRSMAAADSTEVPPNFITITGCFPKMACEGAVALRYGFRRGFQPSASVQHPFRVHQLGIQRGRPRGAADGVVP